MIRGRAKYLAEFAGFVRSAFVRVGQRPSNLVDTASTYDFDGGHSGRRRFDAVGHSMCVAEQT